MTLEPTSSLPPPVNFKGDWRTEDARRRDRHLRLTIAAREAFADPAFLHDLADLKERCRSASRPDQRKPCCDIAFDARHEREEGWALEPIGNVFS